MIKRVNLLTLDLMFKENLVEDYLNEENVDHEELKTLSRFVEEIRKYYKNVNIFKDYIYDYTIPQISKQFDILKVSSDFIINIELKETSTEEKVKKQLKENNYYLRSTGKEVWTFTYVKSDNSIYGYIHENDKISPIKDFGVFFNWLEKKKVPYLEEENINELFNPKQYLISVFNDTEKFLQNHYFLNDLQQRFKRDFIKNNTLFKAIKGEAGTGKTLLLYDIAKDYIYSEEDTLIIHCANLNNGHHTLQSYGWKIAPIKFFKDYLSEDIDAIFIDEAQRLKEDQLNDIVEFAKKNYIEIYFSYDPAQYLHISEKASDIANKILDLKPDLTNRALTKTIRTNEEVNLFIKKMFDNHHNHTTKFNFREFVEVVYFDDIKTSNLYIEELINSSKNEAKVLKFTEDLIKPRRYQNYDYVKSALNSHEVIGQEFNHIVLTLGDYFKYNGLGKLYATCSSYYDVERMFYQLATRAKEKLTLVIVNNKDLIKRALTVVYGRIKIHNSAA